MNREWWWLGGWCKGVAEVGDCQVGGEGLNLL